MSITCREYITKREKKAFVDELVFLCYTPVEEFLFLVGSELCSSLRSNKLARLSLRSVEFLEVVVFVM